MFIQTRFREKGSIVPPYAAKRGADLKLEWVACGQGRGGMASLGYSVGSSVTDLHLCLVQWPSQQSDSLGKCVVGREVKAVFQKE